MGGDGPEPKKQRPRQRASVARQYEPIQSRIRIFVELFSVATGVSFLVAAILHMIVFGMWGLDFTAVASVEDVIMGGIRLLVLVTVIALLFSFIGIVKHMLEAERRMQAGPAGGRWRRRIFIALSTAFMLVLYAAPLGAPSLGVVSMMWLGIALAYVFGIVGFLIYTSPISLKEAMSFEVAAVRRLLIQVAVVGTVISLALLHGGYSNLSVEPTSLLGSRCQLDHRVLWVGSRGVVVACPTGVHAVMRNDVALVLRVRR